ncbi:30S ribosomal protein S3 [Taylorella equigenitalis 14/56]|uniref:Small ribosomal subunit protein uS3 n=3 Tax=Taylorella equigenitalis TaxID=29575 RepID=A0A654KGE7_TAYEM|nr:30S ribosomal protein S3 [Taylorella equigenitalis]ADU91507.1 SSU ribosomal protein S3p (S3e) [Taylorella equigenitalis MCE9]AFN36590.1 30S ribosomal protein S3 [Taylorella equigenitalis ATCC 35865]ASY31154.1 30S ribosomal protein S3 [Taylorella equigenitalis]ASY39990.1 30S ribosomal protein S3 [Taylorella equigenitalis]ASY42923.1 30S ribosomal protein S3 [Taylorella equigenitalis]
MGQKVHPTGFRLAVTRNWNSRWFAEDKDFGTMLAQDLRVREYLKRKLKQASVGRVLIERPEKNARITVFTARPGVIIGKGGDDIDALKSDLQRIMGVPVHINIEEIRKPEVDAQLIADSIAQQLEKRIMFRRAMKRAIQNAMRAGAQGIKVAASGRLNGIEIARTEWYREGRVPLHTLRAMVDYATSEALTTYGLLGIKVWVYKGDLLPNGEAPVETVSREEERRTRRPRGERQDQRRPSGRGRARKAAGAQAENSQAQAQGDSSQAQAQTAAKDQPQAKEQAQAEAKPQAEAKGE